VRSHPPPPADEPGADHVVGLAGEDGGHQPVELLGGILPVGVTEGHGHGAEADRPRQPVAHRRPEALVGVEALHPGTGPSGPNGRGVDGSVVDHHRQDRKPVHIRRHAGHHAGHRRLLVVGGQEEDDRDRLKIHS
jgi:hypothetical protein